MRPSFVTPLLMRKVLACLVMVKNCSSIVSEIFTGLLAIRDKTLHQRFELDVELGAEAAAEERHAHAHPVLRPAEQPRDLHAHERRALRRGVDGERALGRLRRRYQRLERRVHHLLGAEAVLEHAVRLLQARLPYLLGANENRARRWCWCLPLRCFRSGNVPAGLSSVCTIALELTASTSSYTAGSSSYSAVMRCAASSATCGSEASTTATGSPT